jgi:NADP-dependent 3-hydroxy acid dehydrogenase YdfG
MLKFILVWLWSKIYLNLIGAWYVLKEQVFDRHRRLPNLDSERGKTIVITGGSRGIGYEAVKTFLRLGCTVIVGCRNVEQAKELLASEPNKALARVLPLDLMSLSSVREFATDVLATTPAINVLVNNAGIMFGARRETAEGFESQLATNYLGHWLLGHLLMPALERGAGSDVPARIVNVTSCAHYLGSWLDWDDLHGKKVYSPEQAYGNSKAAQVKIVSMPFIICFVNTYRIRFCSTMNKKRQGCGSGSVLDPDSETLWIRIRIGNPDPGARKVRHFSGKNFFLPLKSCKIALTTFKKKFR